MLNGNFDQAVACCLEAGRVADALVLAASGGPELWTQTRDAYLSSSSTPFMATLSAVVHQDFSKYVAESDLSMWKETLALLNTYAAPEELSTLCNQLGERLESDPAAATLCYMCAANIPKTCALWEEYHVQTETPSALLDLMEKLAIFQEAAQTKEGFALVASKVTKFAEILSAQGCLPAAMHYLLSLRTTSFSSRRWSSPSGSTATIRLFWRRRRPRRGRCSTLRSLRMCTSSAPPCSSRSSPRRARWASLHSTTHGHSRCSSRSPNRRSSHTPRSSSTSRRSRSSSRPTSRHSSQPISHRRNPPTSPRPSRSSRRLSQGAQWYGAQPPQPPAYAAGPTTRTPAPAPAPAPAYAYQPPPQPAPTPQPPAQPPRSSARQLLLPPRHRHRQVIRRTLRSQRPLPRQRTPISRRRSRRQRRSHRVDRRLEASAPSHQADHLPAMPAAASHADARARSCACTGACTTAAKAEL